MECMQSIHIMATFQLTTSQGGRHGGFNLQTTDKAFQLTTSRGGRRASARTSADYLIFQLTTSRGGRHQRFDKRDRGCLYFNSRPHEEVDINNFGGIFVWTHFNSRPHEEVDMHLVASSNVSGISTHDLTRRSTGFRR